MATEVKKIVLRKGLNSQLPDLDEGEPGFATDTQKLYVGTSGTTNIELSKVGHNHAVSEVVSLQTALDTKAAVSHTHAISDVSTLQTALDAKAATSHTHAISNVTNLQTSLDAKINTSARGAANGVAPLGADNKVPLSNLPDLLTGGNKGFQLVSTLGSNTTLSTLITAMAGLGGTTYDTLYGAMWVATTTLNITWTDQTTLGPVYTYHVLTPGDEGDATSPVTLEAGDIIVFTKYSDAAGDGDDEQFTFSVINSNDSRFALASHGHAISDVTGLQTALDGKAASSHTHALSEVTNLQTALDTKAAVSHTHAISAITDLQTALDTKANLTGATFTGNVNLGTNAITANRFKITSDSIQPNWEIFESSNKLSVQAIDGGSNPIYEIWHSGTSAKLTLSNNSTQFLNGNGNFITPGISSITSLQTALDAKAPLVHTHNLTSSRTLIATRTGSQITSTAGFSVADLDQFQEIEVVYQNETVVDNGNLDYVYISAFTVAKCERSLISRSFSSNTPFAGSDTIISSLQLVITGVANATVGVIQLRQENEEGTSVSFRTYGTIPAMGNLVYIYGIVILDN